LDPRGPEESADKTAAATHHQPRRNRIGASGPLLLRPARDRSSSAKLMAGKATMQKRYSIGLL
jgi:hypothetical protein